MSPEGTVSAMPETVTWTGFLRVNDDATAQRLLTRVQDALRVEITVGNVERYWKDESLYRCTFTTPLPSEQGSATADALALAGRLAPGWHVTDLAPDTPISGTTSDGIVVSGVTWLGFDLASPP